MNTEQLLEKYRNNIGSSLHLTSIPPGGRGGGGNAPRDYMVRTTGYAPKLRLILKSKLISSLTWCLSISLRVQEMECGLTTTKWRTLWLAAALFLLYEVHESRCDILPVKAIHHNNTALHQVLEALAATYPNITRLYSIGKSYQGKGLWVLEITRNPGMHTPGKPEFKYVANMHGNEVVGREMLLLLADYLCSNYGRDERVTKLVDTTRIHLLPSMNPDGWESSKEGDCTSVRGRFNANGVDLNRNFPDPYDGQRNELQPETQAVMNWIHQEPFVLSANLHGGTLVVNYPFDNLPRELKRSGTRVYYSSPDDDIFVTISKVYSLAHPTMHKGYPQCPIQRRERFPDGITNGAAWYPISGGMQDYNYYKTYGNPL